MQAIASSGPSIDLNTILGHLGDVKLDLDNASQTRAQIEHVTTQIGNSLGVQIQLPPNVMDSIFSSSVMDRLKSFMHNTADKAQSRPQELPCKSLQTPPQTTLPRQASRAVARSSDAGFYTPNVADMMREVGIG